MLNVDIETSLEANVNITKLITLVTC